MGIDIDVCWHRSRRVRRAHILGNTLPAETAYAAVRAQQDDAVQCQGTTEKQIHSQHGGRQVPPANSVRITDDHRRRVYVSGSDGL